MKKLFYIGVLGLALFEVANVYFIMPMPGSQRMNSLAFAYFLYSWRWVFRILLVVLMVAGAPSIFRGRHRWLPVTLLVVTTAIAYAFNFMMVADHMFRQPRHVIFQPLSGNKLGDSSLVVVVENRGQVKGYPVRFIVYHHQVQDTVGGKPILVTYCSVCRTGRVYEPMVKGQHEKFRLVGMDHFNAIFEDETSRSWWRQATGEAVAGRLKGEGLPEVASMQMTVKELFRLYSDALVMQPDGDFKKNYDSAGRFEKGRSRGELTRTDSVSWKEKSWVVGIQVDGKAKAYAWNDLQRLKVVNDAVGSQTIAIVLGPDGQSFAAFRRQPTQQFSMHMDSVFVDGKAFTLSGNGLTDPSVRLDRLNAYQEFWHSWRAFYPQTTQYHL